VTPEDFADALANARRESRIHPLMRAEAALTGETLDPDEWEAQVAERLSRRDNLEHPTRCDRCGDPFEAGDVIYRAMAPWGTSFFGGPTYWLVPHCRECVRPRWHEVEPRPCVTCRRPVMDIRRYGLWAPDYPIACGQRCAARAATVRRRVRHEPRACPVCGADFTPRRSDARYCSGACRQRAYRERTSRDGSTPESRGAGEEP
jgi:hypothetical protein